MASEYTLTQHQFEHIPQYRAVNILFTSLHSYAQILAVRIANILPLFMLQGMYPAVKMAMLLALHMNHQIVLPVEPLLVSRTLILGAKKYLRCEVSLVLVPDHSR